MLKITTLCITMWAVATAAQGDADTPTGQETLLSKDDLVRIATTEAHAVKPDPFQHPKPHRRAGSKFAYSLSFKGADTPGALSSAWWRYDLDQGTLALRVPSAPSDFVLSDTTKVVGERIGQNAFGVRARVARERRVKVSLVALDRPKPATGFYELDVKLSGNAARTLSQLAKVRLEGELVSADGEVAACDAGEVTATLDDPTDLSYRYCSVYGRIQRVIFLGANGEQLKEWTAD